MRPRLACQSRDLTGIMLFLLHSALTMFTSTSTLSHRHHRIYDSCACFNATTLAFIPVMPLLPRASTGHVATYTATKPQVLRSHSKTCGSGGTIIIAILYRRPFLSFRTGSMAICALQDTLQPGLVPVQDLLSGARADYFSVKPCSTSSQYDQYEFLNRQTMSQRAC